MAIKAETIVFKVLISGTIVLGVDLKAIRADKRSFRALI